MTHLAIIRQQYRSDGGAERFVSRALEALGQEGVELTLITRHWEGGGPFRLLTCNPPIKGRISRERDFASAVQKILAEESFDLVQSHERIPGCDLYRAGDGVHREWLTLRRDILSPWAAWWQEYSPYHRYVLRAEKEMFTHPALRAVICNSRMVKQEIISHFGIEEKKLHVIYSGVDTELFHPRQSGSRQILRNRLGIPEQATLFLFVGSGFERKNLRTVIRALSSLPMEAHLAIIGKDSRQGRYERLAQRLGVTGRCHFLGVQRELPALYGMADAFVLPTLYDPFPNVILEAMATGLPIITSRKCGGAELVEGEAGMVLDALDTDRLSQAMEALLDDQIRQPLGKRARSIVENYTLTAMSQQLTALYQQLLDA